MKAGRRVRRGGCQWRLDPPSVIAGVVFLVWMYEKLNSARRVYERFMNYALAIGILVMIIGGILVYGVRMPGNSFKGAPPALTNSEVNLSNRLRNHVYVLAMEIGERNWPCYEALDRARSYIEGQFKKMDLETKSMPYPFQGETFYNVEAILKGSEPSRPCIVIGAHYDSVEGSPGANDNATGVAALLELARLLRLERLSRTIRFVAFANEEPPYFNTGEGMGSIEYVRSFQGPEAAIHCMLSLETIGFYADDQNSQEYPPFVGLFYPNKGNFIAFVGNFGSRRLVRNVVRSFRLGATIPSEGAALPSLIPGVSFSDHRSFWEAGIPALMVTDTAFYRDSKYHLSTDTAERLNYEQMARVVVGLSRAVADLCGEKP